MKPRLILPVIFILQGLVHPTIGVAYNRVIQSMEYPESFSSTPQSILAYHAKRGQMILLVHSEADALSGVSENRSSRIYYWDAGHWQPVPDVPADAGGLNVMVYDSRRDVMVFWQGIVVYRGIESEGTRYQRLGWTWEWDGTHWRLASTQGSLWHYNYVDANNGSWERLSDQGAYGARIDSRPFSVIGLAAAFDARRGKTILFGGSAANTESSDVNLISPDVYEWDGTDWATRPQNPASAPIPVHAAAMAYDPVRQEIVLHGGLNRAGQPYRWFEAGFLHFESQTWTYDGTAFNKKSQSAGIEDPLRRASHCIVYDEFVGRLVMLGGLTYNSGVDPLDDTDCRNLPTPLIKTWDGDRWTDWPLVVTTFAATRFYHGGAYDPKAHHIVIAGGLTRWQTDTSCRTALLPETWQVGFKSTWVDYATFLPELFQTGDFDTPFSNWIRALTDQSSEPYAIFKFKPGAGVESTLFGPLTINRRCILEAPLGAVTIRKQ